MKFILEQIKGARVKLAQKEFIKADKQLSAIETYIEENISSQLEPLVMPKIAEAVKELDQLAKEIRDECLIDDDVSGGYTPDPEGTWINKLYEVINKLDSDSNFTA